MESPTGQRGVSKALYQQVITALRPKKGSANKEV
jgi:hypothetical protein